MLVYRQHGLVQEVCKAQEDAVRKLFIREVGMEYDVIFPRRMTVDEMIDEFNSEVSGMGAELEDI